MVDTTLDKSEKRIKKLNKHIRDITFQYEGKLISFEARMGLSIYNRDRPLDEALKYADKNQITVHRITTNDRSARNISLRT